MILPIPKFDEQALRQPTLDAELPLTGELKLLVSNMIQTMVAAKGVGLAAPQINRPERIFVATLDGEYHVFVNPTITEYSDSKGTQSEGCLSLPGVTVLVRRSKIIRVTYWNAAGQLFENVKFRSLNARIVQHEYDHLQGKLIIDYAKQRIVQ